MPSIAVVNAANEKVDTIELSDAVFGIEPNEAAVHAVVVNYLANQRQGTQSTLTRGEVSGGGKKPWRQKGTGHARQGSTRSPQWRHGGIALGPKPRSYRFTINKKVKALAMKSALSSKVAANELLVLDEIKLDAIKTKEIVKMLAALSAAKKTLIVVPEKDEIIYRSARNIEGVKVAPVNAICVYDILNADTMIVAKDAVSKIEEVYA